MEKVSDAIAGSTSGVADKLVDLLVERRLVLRPTRGVAPLLDRGSGGGYAVCDALGGTPQVSDQRVLPAGANSGAATGGALPRSATSISGEPGGLSRGDQPGLPG